MMDELFAEVKELIPDFGTDKELRFALESAVHYVLDFCHLDELPPQLHSLIIQMLIDLKREENIFDNDEGDMKSIKEGDFLMSFSTRIDKLNFLMKSTHIMRKYKVRLYHYRRLAD